METLRRSSAQSTAMAPSTLDLFILTFNCAKNLINVAVFASHLHAALSQNATGLPDLVVFSLQEVAPLSYSFIGSYFLSPYYARFEEALNLAAVKFTATAASPITPNGERDGTGAEADQLLRPRASGVQRQYTLIRAKNVGMTSIMLFARNPAAVRDVLEAEASFGAGDIGNKGAVGLRVTWHGGEEARTTELTFVAAHLAAMEWNLKRRNANWRSIVSGLTFANPKAVLARLLKGGSAAVAVDATAAQAEPESDGTRSSEDDTQPLLIHQDPALTAAQEAALHNISVFRPSAHLFLAGDLNYRISTTTPPALAPFPSFDKDSENHWSEFLPRDQLLQEKAAGHTLNGLTEAPIAFGPSYKYVVLPGPEGAVNEDAVRAGRRVGVEGDSVDVVPWRWAGHRWPSWCDRVLFWDVPAWVRGAAGGGIDVKAYSSLPVVRTSDHRAVFLRAVVPVLSPAELGAPPPAGVLEAGAVEDDPRVKLPVPVDVEAWGRRAKARRREILVGWSMYLWSTREGAVFIAGMVLVGVASWWAYRVLF